MEIEPSFSVSGYDTTSCTNRIKDNSSPWCKLVSRLSRPTGSVHVTYMCSSSKLTVTSSHTDPSLSHIKSLKSVVLCLKQGATFFKLGFQTRWFPFLKLKFYFNLCELFINAKYYTHFQIKVYLKIC